MSLKVKVIYRMLLFLLYAVSFLPLLSINETIRTHLLGRSVWLVEDTGTARGYSSR